MFKGKDLLWKEGMVAVIIVWLSCNQLVTVATINYLGMWWRFSTTSHQKNLSALPRIIYQPQASPVLPHLLPGLSCQKKDSGPAWPAVILSHMSSYYTTSQWHFRFTIGNSICGLKQRAGYSGYSRLLLRTPWKKAWAILQDVWSIHLFQVLQRTL